MSLNEAQRRAVEHAGSPLIVLAGPGTGKTRVIIERVAHLIEARGAVPERVMAVTFTNKAAAELRSRLAERVGVGLAERVWAGTFHAWGLRALRRFGDRLPIGRRPALIDSAQQRRLLRELILETGVLGDLPAGVGSAVDEARAVIGRLRAGAVSPARALGLADERAASGDGGERAAWARFGAMASLFERYDRACLERGWATFDDLLVRPVELIARDATTAALVRAECAHLVVDEFQDVNGAQIELLAAVAPPETSPDVVVVGDDDQSIYAFRGADERAMARFESRWAGAQRVALGLTYRSAPAIVGVAQRVIERAGERFEPDKRIEAAPQAPREGSVEVVRLEDNLDGGEAIATLIGAEIAGEGDPRWSRFAVIGRSWTELDRVRAALELAGVPVVSAGRGGALRDQGVQDLLAWARLACDPHEPETHRLLVRPPVSIDPGRAMVWARAWRASRSRGETRGLARWVIDEHADDADHGEGVRRFASILGEAVAAAGSERADDAVATIIRRTGVAHADLVAGRERAARVRAVVSVLKFVRERADRAEQPHDLRAFLRYYDDLDAREQEFTHGVGESEVEAEEGVSAGEAEREGAVALMTAHAAKGLEFDTVFLPGVAPVNGWPSSRADEPVVPEGVLDRLGDERSEKERRLDEERRLFYVACTRAQRRLVVLGRAPKSSKATNFLLEVAADGDASVREGREVLKAAGERDAIDRLLDGHRARRGARAALDEAARDARLDAAAALARAGDEGGEPARAIGALGEAARRIAAIAHVRAHGEAPAWAAGAAGEAARALADRVREGAPAPGGHPFEPVRPPLELSFTQIDAYRRCPRCAYVTQVLGVGERAGGAARFGTAMHEALCAFYERWRVADSEGGGLPGERELVALARRAVEAQCPADDELDEGQLAKAEAQARLAWSSLHDPGANIAELELRASFPYECDGRTHRVVAKLDRVDDLGGRARIIDYKTGGASAARTDPKKLAGDLQMGIYVMALRHLREDPGLEGECEYWLLSTGERGRVAFADLDLGRVRREIDGVIRGMLAGEWGRSGACARREDAPVCTILDRA